MTLIERKIEAALVDHFRSEGWSLDMNGDSLADMTEYNDEGDDLTVTINLTAAAKAVAAELA